MSPLPEKAPRALKKHLPSAECCPSEKQSSLPSIELERVIVTADLTVDMEQLLAAVGRKPRILSACTPFHTNVVAQILATAALEYRSPSAINRAGPSGAGQRMATDLPAWLAGRRRLRAISCSSKTESETQLAGAMLERGAIVKPRKQPIFATYIRLSTGLSQGKRLSLYALAGTLDTAGGP